MSPTPKSLLCLLALAILQGLSVAAEASQSPSGTWAPAGEMTLAREGASAVLLVDGRVLVTGGASPGGALASAELYNPATGAFVAAAPMRVARSGHPSVLLEDGRVLVAGGTAAARVLASAEIYDPKTNTWATAGNMTEPRGGPTATMLADGRVLIAGGDGPRGASASLEIFDPAAKVFAAAGVLSSPRRAHAAALLADGRVLIVGGSMGTTSLSSTDVFDPSTGRVSAGLALSTPRAGASATTLLGGKVLVAGGNDGTGEVASAEIYDPAEGAFSSTAGSLVIPRSGHLAFRLPFNNQVLIVGGTSGGVIAAAAELFAPWNDASAPTDPLWTARAGAAGTPLRRAGRLLVTGGTGVASAELYAFPTLTTDKADYAASSSVTIAGTGWPPGEPVSLLLHEQPAIHADRTIAAVADATGGIRAAFQAEPHEVDVRFYVTANGAASQAQSTFTTAAARAGNPGPAPTPAAKAVSGSQAAAGSASPAVASPAAAARPPAGETLGLVSVTDDTVADFSGGAPGACRIVAHTGDADGEVIQQPTVIQDFTGPLGAGWEMAPWALGGGATFAAGQIRVDGARVNTTAFYTAPRTLEFKATFGVFQFQHLGFGETLGLSTETWAIFSTGPTGDQVYAYTRDTLGGEQLTPLGPALLGSEHYYRIEWTAAAVTYYVDDAPVAIHLTLLPLRPMRPILSDLFVGGPVLTADWLRMSPFAPDCTFTSRVFDAGFLALWSSFTSDQREPIGTSITVCVRTGNTSPPSGPQHCELMGTGMGVIGELGRFAQYTAVLASTDPNRMRTPELHSVTIDYAPACDGVVCDDDGNACTIDLCNPETGACGLPALSGTVCRDTAGVCDTAETCDGTTMVCPADGFAPAATECRGSAGVCDVAESCTGTSAACPSDAFVPATTQCRASAGVCDVAESCTGTNAACPADGLAPATTECRGSAGVCDVAERCTGTSDACPADGFAPATTVCRASAGTCDVVESCTGAAAACPADAFAPATTQCRPDSGQCDEPDSCPGTGPACPDVKTPNGTACDDGQFCTTTDRCANGACAGTGNPCRDGNACTPDKCDEANDRCVFNQMCDDDDDGEDDDCDGRHDEEDYDRNGDKEDGHDDDACDDDNDRQSRTCVLKTTGGGKTHNGAEFGFEAKGVIGSWDKGQFNYRGGNVRIYGRVTEILDAYETPGGGVMKFEVTSSNGTRYHVTAEDHGEPGYNRDALKIQKVGGSGAAPNTTARQVVKSGNIQWHASLDNDDEH